jgi:hypothetical protein
MRVTKPTERCIRCRKLGHVAARRDAGPICVHCYNKTDERKAPCTFCKRVMRIGRRTASGAPVCARCAFRRMTAPQTCAVCRLRKRTRRRTRLGEPLCDVCYLRGVRARER